MGSQEGILISDVVKGSPAAKAGLQAGDIIISFNEKPVKAVTKFRNEIALMNPGTAAKLKILRNNKKIDITVTLGSQEAEVISEEFIQKLGIELENLTPDLNARLGYGSETQGVVITKVKPGSPAAQAGIQPGFLITGVAVTWENQKTVRNTTEFQEAIKEVGDKKHLILIIRNQNFQRYYTIKLN
jgi:serine protease Do